MVKLMREPLFWLIWHLGLRRKATENFGVYAPEPDGFDSLEQVADAVTSYQPHRQRPGQLDGLKKMFG